MIKKIIHYIFGEVTLEISGEFTQRALNILAANRIAFWNIRGNGEKISICVYYNSLKIIDKLKEKTGCDIKQVKSVGFPVIFKKYKLRYGFAVGFLLFWAILLFLTDRLWSLEIVGDVQVSEQKMYSALNELGVKRGMRIDDINTETLNQNFLIKNKGYAWAAFNKLGCKLQANLTGYDEVIREDEPCNLIAESDGVIRKIEAYTGNVCVKIGDTVTKGQILVSGIKTSYGKNEFLHSKATILAETVLFYETEIDKRHTQQVFTEKVATKKYLDVFGVKIPLYLGSISGNYKKETENFKVRYMGGELPIYVIKNTYRFYENVYTDLDEQSAKAIIEEKIKKEMEDINAAKFEIKSSNITNLGDKYKYTAQITVLKDICQKDFLKITGEKFQ